MERHRRLLVLLSALACALVLPVAAGAAEIVDRNVAAPELQVDSRNVALITYSVKGVKRHVLYWGAVDWAEKFSRDYSGGWKSKVADYKRFSNNCKPYTGPPPAADDRRLRRQGRLALGAPAVAAAVEELRRRQGRDRALHLALADDAAELAIQTDYSYRGKLQHLWGRFHVPRQAGLRHEVDDLRASRSTARAATSTSTTWRSRTGAGSTAS